MAWTMFFQGPIIGSTQLSDMKNRIAQDLFELLESNKEFTCKGEEIMDVSLNPTKASSRELIERTQQLGKRIRVSKRRFIAMLPEIERRKLWKELNYDNTIDLAKGEAELSHGMARRILNTAERIAPHVAIRRLFECSDIGWTKFETISKVLTKENANDFLHQLKTATRETLDKLAQAIKAEKKTEQEAKERAEAKLRAAASCTVGIAASSAPSSAASSAASGTASSVASSDSIYPVPENNGQQTLYPSLFGGSGSFVGKTQSVGLTPISMPNSVESPMNCPVPLNSPTSIDGPTSIDSPTSIDGSTSIDSPTANEGVCSCGAVSRKGVGTIYYQSGKAVINVPIYADVAELLLQRADKDREKKKKKKSLIARISKAVKELLFDDDDTDSSKLDKNGKRKPKLQWQVITFDGENSQYKTKTRYGDVEVPLWEVRDSGANINDPLDMNELYEQAVNCAEDYMASRFALGKELTRYIPALVRKYVVLRSKGFFCEFPGCKCHGYQIHHLRRFALNNNCNPNNLVVLCKFHHDLAHVGALGGEDGPIEELSIDISQATKRFEQNDERAKVDAKVKAYKDRANKNRHKAKWQKSSRKRVGERK